MQQFWAEATVRGLYPDHNDSRKVFITGLMLLHLYDLPRSTMATVCALHFTTPGHKSKVVGRKGGASG
jgi:hypothetical protein